jgi:hypothetical protein
LKAQIQQLLKDVSGELRQLQAQLSERQAQPPPEAGIGTDPELYESPTPLGPATGENVPIQLQADATETPSTRPGSGVGRPSGEMSNAAPQARAEDAQLSVDPIEEAPTERQAVPPEYRNVFDRLRQRHLQPTGEETNGRPHPASG